MSRFILDEKSEILVVDATGLLRPTISDVLRKQGYRNIHGMSSVYDAFNHLKNEKADWIISPIYPSHKLNGLALLKVCLENPALKDVKTTLLIEEDELDLVPAALSLGALSYIGLPLSKQIFHEEVLSLKAGMNQYQGDSCQISAKYARRWLKENKRFTELVEFEEILVSLYPSSQDIFFESTIAKILDGRKEEARTNLIQIEMTDPMMADSVRKIFKKSFKEEMDEGEGAKENKLDLGLCVVVDPDETVQQAIADYLAALGAKEIFSFDDAEAAFEWLKDKDPPNLITQGWRMPGMSGPNFLQRVRQLGHFDVPILVISSVIQKEDFPLVREMGVAGVLTKPLQKHEFVNMIIWTKKQQRFPTEQRTMEEQIFNLFASGKTKEAVSLCRRYIGDESISALNKKLVTGELMFHQGEYQHARELAEDYMKTSGLEPSVALNLVGKACMKLGEYGEALKAFDKAQQRSPQNIQRLCTIAEVQEELGDQTGANQSLASARDIDKGNHAVLETTAKISVGRDDPETAKKALAELQSLNSYVSSMNNKAVAYIHHSRIPQGIKIYLQVLRSLPDAKSTFYPVIAYNLCLAFCKQGELKEANRLLAQVVKFPKSQVYKKAKSLKEKTDNCLKTGKKLELNSDKPEFTESLTNLSGTQSSIKIKSDFKPGEFCCHKVFEIPNEFIEAAKSLLEDIPKFEYRGPDKAAS